MAKKQIIVLVGSLAARVTVKEEEFHWRVVCYGEIPLIDLGAPQMNGAMKNLFEGHYGSLEEIAEFIAPHITTGELSSGLDRYPRRRRPWPPAGPTGMMNWTPGVDEVIEFVFKR